jgi:hypothetical protein
MALYTDKKSRGGISKDISATRLSRRDPVGFPSHPCGWFSIIVYPDAELFGNYFPPEQKKL